MNDKPPFFEQIRRRASERWDQLEKDPELAGPWHQLFKQVQSPRHILSELLQNADDAGATEASVSINNGFFVFAHNGEDFTEEHFASLCRFGYSNKRALHTIGFRGIGFKSTFSLGDSVELYTSTLAVSFDKQRFTEPKWLNPIDNLVGQTLIRVAIKDEHRTREVEKNLQEWLKSPLSLLFFKHIRSLQIGEHKIHWSSLGTGPVPETEWMALHDNPDSAFLLARSKAEPFPEDALTEIKQERLVGIDQNGDFPPCKVEIVLGAKGRLFVVLPTGVETSLPFASNAPFIQDPARLKIKDPEISPTNRWLLNRAGALAARVMLKWLEHTSAGIAERSRAYGFFPDVDRDDNALEGICATIVEEAFEAAIENEPFLLTDTGELKNANESVVIPHEMYEVWPLRAAALLDEASRPAFSHFVSRTDREKLLHWAVLAEVNKDRILELLLEKHLPKPANWRCLLKLWAFVAPEVTGYLCRVPESELRIVPVQGKNVLYSADEIVRLGEKKLLQSEKDWEFLAAHLLVLNQNWPRFLAEKRRSIEDRNDKETTANIKAAFAVLDAIDLQETSDVSDVIEKFAAGFFNQQPIALPACIQLAQIAAKLGATIDDSFRFVTRDLKLRAAEDVVLFDKDGTLEEFLPKAWCLAHLLHVDYSKTFNSCTREEWIRWIGFGRAGLHSFVPFVQKPRWVFGRKEIEAEIRRRGFSSTPVYPYKSNSFQIEDWDFEESLWHYWTTLSKDNAGVWGHLVEYIFEQPVTYWSKAQSVRVVQIATTGSRKVITYSSLLPGWLLKLRDLPCLRDTRGFHRKPCDLFRRTAETESLMDVEPFIHAHLDIEATRPLLKLLGVQDKPSGPHRLLERLRVLAKAGNPPAHEVEKWYRRLDQMADNCSTTDFANIKKAFWDERIILTEDGSWTVTSAVFLFAHDQDVPEAPIIRASVRDLAFWRKMGVAERPTADLAIKWLKGLPSGKQLSQDDARRVQSLLGQHAKRIWFECGHWVNLAGEWAPVDTLIYSLSMQSLVRWKHLHEWVKRKTADLQRLPVEVSSIPPFSDLAHLASCIEERFHSHSRFSSNPERKVWLNHLGSELSRIEVEDKVEETRIRNLAARLGETKWSVTSGLEIIPYISGIPAGTPGYTEIVWLDQVLYVDNLSNAKLAFLVAEKLGKIFGHTDITTALSYCFERSPREITEFIEENFQQATAEPLNRIRLSEREMADSTRSVASPATAVDHELFGRNDDDASERGIKTGYVSESQNECNSIDTFTTKGRPIPKPTKPSIIERFARSHGFQKDGNDGFCHSDGGLIRKTDGGSFPWERRAAAGELVCYYWPKDHCLEKEPLQLEADIWGLIDKFPETHALVLTNVHGDPIEVAGAKLCKMREQCEIVLYPATYRLVLGCDNQ